MPYSEFESAAIKNKIAEEWDIEEMEKQHKLLSRTKGYWYLPFLPIPIVFVIDYIQRKYYSNSLGKLPFVGKGNTISNLGHFAIFFLCFIDDFGTAKGFQAKENLKFDQTGMHEGNPHVSVLLEKIHENYGVSHSTGLRWVFLYQQGLILFLRYFKQMSPLMRSSLYIFAAMKVYAGYGWWLLQPNDFSFFDLFYKDGEPTPNRMYRHLKIAMKESVDRRTREVGQQMFPREVQTDIHWPETMREQSAPMRRNLMSREEDTTRFYTKMLYLLFP